MGILNKAANKFKGLFVEEVPEKKVEVKKEVYKVEIAAPEEEISKQENKEPEVIIPEEIEETKKEPEEVRPKKEESFKFPVYFNDDDIDKINQDEDKREESIRTTFTREDLSRESEEYTNRTSFRDAYGTRKEEKTHDFASAYKKETPKKTFTPTPIISPVYGILDKNYSKEDITTKKSNKLSSELTSENFTIDEVRKKAYGTLEDDIETSLLGNIIEEDNKSEELFDDIEQENTDNIMADELLNSFDDEFDDSYTKNILDDFDTPVEETLSRDYDNIEETPKKKTKRVTKKEEITSEDDEDIDMTESDLFNLIDSWYEKRDED